MCYGTPGEKWEPLLCQRNIATVQRNDTVAACTDALEPIGLSLSHNCCPSTHHVCTARFGPALLLQK